MLYVNINIQNFMATEKSLSERIDDLKNHKNTQ